MKKVFLLVGLILTASGGLAWGAGKHSGASGGSPYHGELAALIYISGSQPKKQDEAKALLRHLMEHFDCDYDSKDSDGNPTSVRSDVAEPESGSNLSALQYSTTVTCRSNPADNSNTMRTFPASSEENKSCAEMKCNYSWSVDKAYGDGSGSYLEAAYVGRVDF